MNVFYIILNKIKRFFYKNQISNSKIYKLEEPKISYSSDQTSEKEIKKEISTNINDKSDMDLISGIENSSEDKKIFFEMYNAYKNNTINPKNILITDLIKINLMLEKEKCILDKEIETMKIKADFQKEKLQQLIKEESNLRNQYNNNVNSKKS